MEKYFLVNVQQDASPDWRAVVRAATAEQAAEAAIAAWEEVNLHRPKGGVGWAVSRQ